MERLIQTGVDEGADLLLDGRGITVEGYENGNFVGPTIFDNVTTDMQIYSQEIFGPVLCIMRAADLDEAIEIINASPNGERYCHLYPIWVLQLINSSKILMWVKWVLTCRFLCHYRCSHSQAHVLVSLAIWVLMVSRQYSSIPKPKRSLPAGLMMKRVKVRSTPRFQCSY